MAAQRKTAAQRKAEAEAAEAAQVAAEEGKAADQTPPNGVFIEKAVTEDGNLQVNVAPVGNVQVTEVQTLIEVGLKTFREQIGLGQSRG